MYNLPYSPPIVGGGILLSWGSLFREREGKKRKKGRKEGREGKKEEGRGRKGEEKRKKKRGKGEEREISIFGT